MLYQVYNWVQGREEENSDRNRDGSGNDGGGENGDTDGNGNKNGSGDGDEDEEDGVEVGEPRNQQSYSFGGSEHAREGATSTSHHQPQQDTISQRDRCNMRKTRTQGRERVTGAEKEGQRSATNVRRVIDVMWKTGETQVEGETNVDKRVLVQ